MKKILLLMISNILLSLSNMCMEKPAAVVPQSEIPLEIKSKYDEEKKRFAKYDLEHPEKKFLPRLRAELDKDINTLKYLEMLQWFANQLLAQHSVMQEAINTNYIIAHYDALVQRENAMLASLGKQKPGQSGEYSITVPNEDVLEQLLANSTISLNSKREFTPAELEIIFNWIVDPKEDPWMQEFGYDRILIQEAALTKKLSDKSYKSYDDKLAEIIRKTPEPENKIPRIINDNIFLLHEITQNAGMYRKRAATIASHAQQSLRAIKRDFEVRNRELALLYQFTHAWYEKLYEIIRTEIASTIGQAMAKNPKDISTIATYAKTFYENLIGSKTLPKELPPLKNSAEIISLPSLDKDLAQFKKEWHSKREQKRIEELKAEQAPIVIHNDKNKTTEIIFKTDKPNQIATQTEKLPNIDYTDWVQEWFNNPEEALKKQGYLDPKNIRFTPEHLRWKMIANHAFSSAIDEHIKKWGTMTTTPSRRKKNKNDILITIPGKIIYPPGSNPKEEAGVFAYIIDSENGQWYHRMFTPESGQSLVADLFQKGYFSPEMTGYYEVFFPSLPAKK